MGKLRRVVFYTEEILSCYNDSELYTTLYVDVLYMCIPAKATFDISGSPLESPWDFRKYPGYNGQVCTWMCMCVCAYEGVPIFCGISICNYPVHPAVAVAIISGETNDFVKQSWCQYFIKYEHLCINSPPSARIKKIVEKCSRMSVKIVSLVDWSYHVNAIH